MLSTSHHTHLNVNNIVSLKYFEEGYKVSHDTSQVIPPSFAEYDLVTTFIIVKHKAKMFQLTVISHGNVGIKCDSVPKT